MYILCITLIRMLRVSLYYGLYNTIEHVILSVTAFINYGIFMSIAIKDKRK